MKSVKSFVGHPVHTNIQSDSYSKVPPVALAKKINYLKALMKLILSEKTIFYASLK